MPRTSERSAQTGSVMQSMLDGQEQDTVDFDALPGTGVDMVCVGGSLWFEHHRRIGRCRCEGYQPEGERNGSQSDSKSKAASHKTSLRRDPDGVSLPTLRLAKGSVDSTFAAGA